MHTREQLWEVTVRRGAAVGADGLSAGNLDQCRNLHPTRSAKSPFDAPLHPSAGLKSAAGLEGGLAWWMGRVEVVDGESGNGSDEILGVAPHSATGGLGWMGRVEVARDPRRGASLGDGRVGLDGESGSGTRSSA
jgi:hypothetical protein